MAKKSWRVRAPQNQCRPGNQTDAKSTEKPQPQTHVVTEEQAMAQGATTASGKNEARAKAS
eukprot:2821199-Amphidinium_carterae.1